MLKELYGMKYNNDFVFFFSGATPFSNFYKRAFSYKGYTLNYGEQAFMLEKALMFDPSKVEAIVKATNPADVKHLGRAVKNFDDKIWKARRYEIMKNVLRAKFSDAGLRQLLLSTGNRTLVEASPYDRTWGIGLSTNDPKALNPNNWRGSNLLGKALMEIRTELNK